MDTDFPCFLSSHLKHCPHLETVKQKGSWWFHMWSYILQWTHQPYGHWLRLLSIWSPEASSSPQDCQARRVPVVSYAVLHSPMNSFTIWTLTSLVFCPVTWSIVLTLRLSSEKGPGGFICSLTFSNELISHMDTNFTCLLFNHLNRRPHPKTVKREGSWWSHTQSYVLQWTHHSYGHWLCLFAIHLDHPPHPETVNHHDIITDAVIKQESVVLTFTSLLCVIDALPCKLIGYNVEILCQYKPTATLSALAITHLVQHVWDDQRWHRGLNSNLQWYGEPFRCLMRLNANMSSDCSYHCQPYWKFPPRLGWVFLNFVLIAYWDLLSKACWWFRWWLERWWGVH